MNIEKMKTGLDLNSKLFHKDSNISVFKVRNKREYEVLKNYASEVYYRNYYNHCIFQSPYDKKDKYYFLDRYNASIVQLSEVLSMLDDLIKDFRENNQKEDLSEAIKLDSIIKSFLVMNR